MNILRYAKLFGVTAIYQIAIQVIALLSGFLIVRLLPTDEYASYTIANTMLGVMTVLSDGGINSSFMYQGGKVWQDKFAFSEIFSTAHFLRKRFALITLVIGLPLLFFLLQKQHVSILSSLLVIATLIPAFVSSLSDNLLQVGPKLNQNIFPIQKNTLLVSLIRFFMVIPLLLVFPFTWLCLLLNGLTRMYGNFRLWQINKLYFNRTNKIDHSIKKKMIRQVARLLPASIYYCFSGQIAIWLMSILGSNSSVAGLGALGRFSLIFSIFSLIFGTIITPRFSRISDKSDKLFSHFIKIQIAGLLAGFFISILFFLFSNYLLLLIGRSYLHLRVELFWSIVAGVIGTCAGFSFSLFTCRGWSIHPIFSIGINVSSIIAGVLCFEINTLKGVLMMNVFVNSVQYLLNTSFCFYKIKYSK
ncbi:MAG: polysaccharide biosynthesis protein [Ferruginibacter sp.]|nr:polysaccharide biosynthesis protein [Ferruginibacter sp.]